MALLLLLLPAVGCESEADPATPTPPPVVPEPPSPPPEPPPSPPLDLPEDPDAVILEVDRSGGFLPIEVSLARLPSYVLTRGGRLYAEAPRPEIFPGSLMQTFHVTELGEPALEAVLDALSRSGLVAVDGQVVIDDLSQFIADAPTTEVTYRSASSTHTAFVYALFFDELESALAAGLRDLIEALGAASETAPPSPHVSDRLRVTVIAGTPLPETPYLRVERWPLPEPPAFPPDASDASCQAYEGDAAHLLQAVFRGATTTTRYQTDDGGVYLLVPRLLLSHEEDCPN